MPALNETAKRVAFFAVIPAVIVWLIGLTFYMVFRADFTPPPIRYSESVYQPLNAAPHCAGGTIEYSPRLTVLEDADLVVTRAIRKDNTNAETGEAGRRTVATVDEDDRFIVQKGDIVQGNRYFVIPATLPAGDYVMVASARVIGRSLAARYEVPFTVSPCD